MGRICRYLSKNQQRMRYDEYLRQGYPLIGGWRFRLPTLAKAEARGGLLLSLSALQDQATLLRAAGRPPSRLQQLQREVHLPTATHSQRRIERETQRLYPHRHLVAGETYFALAA